MTLAKAMLVAVSGEGSNITFMFNPVNLKFSRGVTYSPLAAFGSKGFPKVQYDKVSPYTLTINDILFDTFEAGTSVMTEIDKFRATVEPTVVVSTDKRRPPRYWFAWPEATKYVQCVVTNFSYDLTLFLQDGTPVRAKANLTLQEIEDLE